VNVFLAMLLDTYRELNSKKLFWITLALSSLVVAVFAFVGISETGIKVLLWELPIEITSSIISPATFYKLIFVNLGVKIWLTWIASILALVSTAAMIPDFVAGGAIELTLSKPISRARLFLTKYICCLLFTALQVTMFSTAAFFLIGIKGNEWMPLIFLSIPIVVLVYSFLYCVCALAGLLTRSTIASILITMVFWFALFAINTTDSIMVGVCSDAEARVEALEKSISRMETAARTSLAAAPGATPDAQYTQAELDVANPLLPARRERLEEERESVKKWTTWSRVFFGIKTVLPKTTESIEVLERQMIKEADLENLIQRQDDQVNIRRRNDPEDVRVKPSERARRVDAAMRSRPLSWIIGTSIAFEVLVLGVATVIFSRREF
jgi:ABC-type transport system involved in multi-copper enzyme maturation permease subunit